MFAGNVEKFYEDIYSYIKHLKFENNTLLTQSDKSTGFLGIFIALKSVINIVASPSGRIFFFSARLCLVVVSLSLARRISRSRPRYRTIDLRSVIAPLVAITLAHARSTK